MKNAFSINIIFLLLTIIGLALLPRLTVQLQPNRTGESLHVTYQWPGMGADVLEKEVTSPIEGTLSSIRGIQKITSSSRKGSGRVDLTFKEGTDMDVARFEVSSLMRSLHSELPEGVSLPRVTYNRGGEDDAPLLMVYTINGEGSPVELQDYASQQIVPHLSRVEGIESVQATGAPTMEWEISYNKERLNNLGIKLNDLREAILTHIDQRELGTANIEKNNRTKSINLTLSGREGDSIRWDKIVVTTQNHRILHLTDVATVRLQEAKATSYYRVNGLSSIYVVIHSAKGANQMKLAKAIHQNVERLSLNFPPNFSMMPTYDASQYIREEVTKITTRTLLAIIILLIFVLLVSRQWRYLLIISLSLFANLSIAVIFYYLFHIEIHLYSLAGITVSLGMIIDNTIVMTDHLRHTGNRRAFLAILAATLTTMGALTIIFFLKKEQQLNLIDFAIVLIVNLSVSLAIALFFVPALMNRLPLKVHKTQQLIRRKRRVVRWNNRYEKFISFGLRRRRAFLLLFILGFGLPVFLLPDKIKSNDDNPKWYVSLYNKTLGNDTYVNTYKPWINRLLGGSWYWFTNYFASGRMDWGDQQTKLYVRAQMPDGSTIEQLNNVFIDFENFIAGFKEVQHFTSAIYGIDNASIEISFTKEAEHSSFPHILKQQLIEKATQTGGVDFSIYGVGLGFSNATNEGIKNNHLQFRGYNYDLMLEIARQFKDSLLTNPRIQEVVLQSSSSYWMQKPRYEFVMDLDEEKLSNSASSLRNVYYNLIHHSPQAMKAGYITGNQGAIPIRIREENHNKASVWQFNNKLLPSETAFFRLKDAGTLVKERTGNVIKKENQEYRLNMEYDFIGPYELNKRVRERWLEKIKSQLPVGFTIVDQSTFRRWNREEKGQYWLLLIILAIIFMLCAILFESLRQPLIVIAAIPVSFIGLFLTFSIFKIDFDQGGYAAMILLAGLTVNAALYIINDFNNLMQKNNPIKRFLKAFNHKIIPILLTTLSTILGLLPFLLGGKNEGFWFSLAAGAIGGLIFSIIGVVVLMPLLQLSKNSPGLQNSEMLDTKNRQPNTEPHEIEDNNEKPKT